MTFFTTIPDAFAVIHMSGVYRQVPLFERGGKVYARFGSGYVRLSNGGSTSHPKIRWAEIDPGLGSYAEVGAHVVWTAPAAERVAA